jgi:hypothetical protein
MPPRIHAATRKGLITVERGSGGWRIAHTAFIGEPVTMVLHDHRTGMLYAALRLGHFGPKLHRSDNGGKDWQACTVPTFPATPNETEKGPSVDTIWALETSAAGTLWAGTTPGGLFRSRDQGDSWELINALWDRPERSQWFGGGYDQPGIHSICLDPRDNARIQVAVSCGGVWHSDDDGVSWSCRTQGMRAAYMPPDRQFDPNIQDPHRMVSCRANPDVLWVQHHNGIFRSTDGALSWQEITAVNPSVFGFAVAVHPTDPDTAWFVPAVKDECRVPVNQQLVVTRTRDGGQNFDILRTGLPQAHSYDLVYRHGLDIDSSGDCLAFGSTTGNLWVSEDQGDSWQLVSNHLPPIYCVRFE